MSGLLLDACRMFWIAHYANLWVYPVLQVLHWTERVLFLVTCWLLMFACYFVGELLTSVLWREYHPLYRCLFCCTALLSVSACCHMLI